MIVFENVSLDSLLNVEEIFGFVVGVIKFWEEDEVIWLVNNIRVGFVFYFYIFDFNWFWCVFEVFVYGMVGVNMGLILMEVVLFGGCKELGIGREGFKYGFEEFLEFKMVCM